MTINNRQIHLVRHGEVHNPSGVLYEQIPGFALSELGRETAQAAADYLVDAGRDVRALLASPLLRAQQSAEPIATAYGLEIVNEHRIVEPRNRFAGEVKPSLRESLKTPKHWGKIWNPLLPSWGEPYLRIRRRALAAMRDAWNRYDGDVVLVTHQAVVWAVHLAVAGEPPFHNPKKRRAALSSVTSFTVSGGDFIEVAYASPADELLWSAVDRGAV